ncbi:MAG TPA: serpin family protein [Propionibacteriaceae bacterium]|nr:serpin family protein [Propionibacteriaceae bacterium]
MRAIRRRTALRLLGLSGLALWVPVSGCEKGDARMAISDVPRAPQGGLVRSSLTPFASRLLDAMPQGNAVLSPASVAVVLAMLGNGTATTTREEVETVLGSPVGALNVELNGLAQRLVALAGQKGTEVTFWDALWLQKDTTWKKPFLDALKEWYGAGAMLADFIHDPADAVTRINTWCDAATKGLISSIVDRSMITPDTRVVAGNAVRIKGDWASPFEPSLTRKQPFRTGSGSPVDVDMMHGMPYLRYLRTDAMTSVALPFRHEDLAFIVALPANGSLTLSGLPDLTGVLDGDRTELNLSLPKFRAELAQPLKDPLTRMGLVDAWKPGVADFSAITGDRSLNLDFVQHKAVLRVDEKGAEGAAVTAGGATATALPALSFTVDRPFFWAVAHVPTRSLVMLGRETDPTRVA